MAFKNAIFGIVLLIGHFKRTKMVLKYSFSIISHLALPFFPSLLWFVLNNKVQFLVHC